MKKEIQRRQTNVSRLRDFFLARPLTWIRAEDLEPIAGRQAWRTRVSELRKQLEQEALGTIENMQLRKMRVGEVISLYRYLPHIPLARDAGTQVSGQRELFTR